MKSIISEVLLRKERGGFFEVGLEDGGDVTIFVGSTAGRAAAFTLTVEITNMTDIRAREMRAGTQ